MGCPTIAEEFGEKYESIDQATINHFLRDHPKEYREWRDRNFKDDVRLADRKARLAALERKADLLGRKIDEILKTMPPKHYGACSLTFLLKEYREYIDQIRDESGDKETGGKRGTEQEPFVLKVISHVPGE